MHASRTLFKAILEFTPHTRTKTLTIQGCPIYDLTEFDPRRVRMNMPMTVRLCLLLVSATMACCARAPATPLPPVHPDTAASSPTSPQVSVSSTPDPVDLEPARSTRHFGLAGLGLMATALGAYWRMHRGTAARRRLWRRRCAHGGPPAAGAPIAGLIDSHCRAPGRHRVRRYDYDRFYLRMVRDL